MVKIIFYPFSLVYGFIMMVRNWLFDLRIFPSKIFDIPLISIGNLSLGGTGKTPHIEYLVRLLKDRYFTAILSRGYGRKSEGFLLGSRKSNVKYIGDEPLQFIKKFDKIKVAVDEKRERGITKLLNKFPTLDVILLDDAFQHRWIKPGVSILLTDYHNLFFDDHVVPAGRLREFRCGAKRADIIVVTKTPRIFSPISRRRILDDLKPKSHQKTFFSYIKYGDLIPLYENVTNCLPDKISFILLFTGIASDELIKEHLERKCNDLSTMKFRDHHQYNLQDIEKIKSVFDGLPSQKKIIVTTEKDVMRLKTTEISAILKNLPIFYLPIEVDFHGKDKELFDEAILTYVEKNKRNHLIPGS